ncbi:tyrosine-protein phosphatase [Paucisalibacillus globulus]|uniref:tyrosine-protein phosphatase n=1 Tax=Paucisalibacillus globulus TaxID=351095 RepID=UPI00041CA088|nr:CpsB/CapC family capsule biosynthesis tyrosine phosphatase [Paucisalibacillus globulus]
MIDIHCHILHGVDDGPKTRTDSLAMAQAAVNEGIHTIIASPHHQNGIYINSRLDIEAKVMEFNRLMQEENIPLTVLVGQETRLHRDMIKELQMGVITPLNNTKYVFIEFPSGEVPRYAEQMLFEIQVAGYTPIIVHPERNRQIAENPSILYNLVQKGSLTQLTAASIVGKFGKAIQKLSYQLIESNLTHFIASDAHNTTSRGFRLKEAYEKICKRYGDETFYMYMENARLLINGEDVYCYEPQNVKKQRKIFGVF